MEKKLVFLLYDNRSGSTLLSALLNRYKGISVSQESTFISRIIESNEIPPADHIEKIFCELSKEIQFSELDFNTEKIIEKIKESRKGTIQQKELISLILTEYFEQRDPEAMLRVVKLGDYLYIREILEMFPDSMFLQIIRDGRAVFNSKKNTRSFAGGMQETNVLHAAWNWVQKLKKAELYKQKFITIRYEDLIKDAESSLSSILDQLNIPSDLRVKTKEQEDYFHDLGMRQKPLHQNIEKKPQEDFIDKWKDQLSKKESMVYTYWSERYLKKYGYEVLTFPKYLVCFYSFQYLITYLFSKAADILKLLKTPSLLRRKLKRKIRMMLRR